MNGGYSPLNDGHFFGTKVVEMYEEWYDGSPLKSTPLQVKVHWGTDFVNARWDGQSTLFGDGNSTVHPMTSLGIVAHEVSHGVTEQSSGLLYWQESGALNEAFSDMAGASFLPSPTLPLSRFSRHSPLIRMILC